jgi:hypothetical protein
MADYLSTIIEIAAVATPIETPSESDWQKAEAELGLHLPLDYKALVSAIGSGRFGNLGLRNPVEPHSVANFERESYVDFHNQIAEHTNEKTLRLFPKRNGFLHLGGTPFGCELFVRPSASGEPPYDLCWFNLDEEEGRFLKMSLSRFLHDLYLNHLDEDWAVEDREMIWEDDPRFFSPGVERLGGTAEPLNY